MIWGAAVLLPALIWITISDIREFRIPDRLSLPLIGAGLAVAPFSAVGIWQGLLGAVLGYACFVIAAALFRRARGVEGLGRGDAKLLAAGGAWCGIAGLPLIVLIASVSGLVFALIARLRTGRLPRILPFAPFLAGAIAAVFLHVAL